MTIRFLNRGKEYCFSCNKIFDRGYEIDFDGKFLNRHKLCLECAKKLYSDLSNSPVINPKKEGLKNYAPF